jgi:hypothetical protein
MATYQPDPTATWLVAVRGSVVLMAPSSAAAELAALWPRLADDDPTSFVLDRLTAGGLAATPAFALVVRDAEQGSVRAVVRGELTVRSGDAEISGAGVSTWTERVVESETFEVAVAGSSAESSLPVVEAVVPARSVRSQGVEPVAPAVPASAAPAQTMIAFPSTPPPAAEQTMVPAEDTIAGPSTPAQPMPVMAAVAAPGPHVDHDGLTVARIDLRRLRAERAARAPGETPASGLPSVAGAADARTAPTPAASLRMPDGALEPIGHDVVLGRAPSVSQVSGGRLPRLITIGAGDPDISRSHVRIAVEGDTVVITDLHSRNGTHVVAPGKPPVKLRGGEPTPVLAGTVVDLGGGWTVQVVGD